jgi:hypothetical protein
MNTPKIKTISWNGGINNFEENFISNIFIWGPAFK